MIMTANALRARAAWAARRLDNGAPTAAPATQASHVYFRLPVTVA